jgi:hypothetical protein
VRRKRVGMSFSGWVGSTGQVRPMLASDESTILRISLTWQPLRRRDSAARPGVESAVSMNRIAIRQLSIHRKK